MMDNSNRYPNNGLNNMSGQNVFNSARGMDTYGSRPIVNTTNAAKTCSVPQKIIKYNEYDFENSAVIKPPTMNDNGDKGERKRTNVIVDSRDRNIDLFPLPSDYLIELNEELQDITACELVLARIPFMAYIVNEGNNKITVRQAGNTYDVIIVPGNYSPEELATCINSALDTVIGTVTGALWKVDFVPVYDKYNIYSSVPFDVLFSFVSDVVTTKIVYPPKSMGKLIGFDRKTYSSILESASAFPLTPYVVRAPFRRNFDEHNYIVLDIEGFATNSSVNSVVNKSFGVIPSVSDDINIKGHNYQIRKNFNPPTPRLAKLRIRFKDINGNLYDFQNHDHRLEFVFEGYKQIRKYNSYFDN